MRVLLVIDDIETRLGIQFRLRSRRDVSIAGAVHSQNDLQGIVESIRPDIVLVDWHLQHASGHHLLRSIQRSRYPCAVVVLGDSADAESLDHETGVHAFTSRSESAESLIRTFQAVVEGKNRSN